MCSEEDMSADWRFQVWQNLKFPIGDFVQLFIYLHKVLFMSESVINTLREYLSSQPVLKAWLFGSYSRGEETVDSDIDLLVSFDSTARISLMKLSGMSLDLEELLGREVDVVLEGSLRTYAEASVNRDKILIYARS